MTLLVSLAFALLWALFLIRDSRPIDLRPQLQLRRPMKVLLSIIMGKCALIMGLGFFLGSRHERGMQVLAGAGALYFVAMLIAVLTQRIVLTPEGAEFHSVLVPRRRLRWADVAVVCGGKHGFRLVDADGKSLFVPSHFEGQRTLARVARVMLPARITERASVRQLFERMERQP